MSGSRPYLIILVTSAVAALAVGSAGSAAPAREARPAQPPSAEARVLPIEAGSSGPAAVDGSEMRGDAVDWAVAPVDATADFGTHASAAIHPDDDSLYVSYYDATYGDIRLAHPTEAGSGNCGPDQDWSCETLDIDGDVGRYNSIAIWEG